MMTCVRYLASVIIFILFSATVSSADIKRVNIPLEGSPSVGPVNAPLAIVEFLDYQ